jgi:hypothetical protein
MPGVIVDDRPHAEEHAIEVQLPFLQSTLNHFQILPVAVGEVDAHRVAALLESLWGGPETLIVISSDLSHYHPYRQAQWRDKATIAQIRQLDATLNGDQACGAGAINGLLLAACRHRLTPHLLDLRNSGDTAGDRERVVGYASIVLRDPRPCPPLKRSEKPCLPRPATPFAGIGAARQGGCRSRVARRAWCHLCHPDPRWRPARLHRQPECPPRPGQDVRENAIAAALRDPRFLR